MFSSLYDDLIDEILEDLIEWRNNPSLIDVIEILENLVERVLERHDEIIGN